MILAEELRIGNFVYVDVVDYASTRHLNSAVYKRVEVLVESIWQRGINVMGAYGGGVDCEHSWRDLEPIPLTPEILNKFGWKYQDTGYATNGYWSQKEGHFSIGPNYNYDKEEDDGYVFTANGNEYVSSSPIYYLHQLQNLYYALTGTELIYTP